MDYVDAVNSYADRNADYSRRLQYAIENELGNLLLQLIREAVRGLSDTSWTPCWIRPAVTSWDNPFRIDTSI